jgi:hypothetical protein
LRTPGPSAVRLALLLCLASSTIALPARAADTDCAFGGPTPGWAAIKLTLPTGTPFLTLELGGARTARPVYEDQNWHLAEGVVVINAATNAIEAFRIESAGMAPRRAVVRNDGSAVVDQAIPAADVPYEHHTHRLRDGLPAGTYYVVAFGVDGGKALPNEWWRAGVQVGGQHPCTRIGSGTTFDIDHTDFTGGTQAYVPGAGYADAITHGFTIPQEQEMVVGLIDAQTQIRAASTVELSYEMPSGTGSFSQDLIPFVSAPGPFAFEASFAGTYPVIAIAGVAIDLP